MTRPVQQQLQKESLLLNALLAHILVVIFLLDGKMLPWK
jgi:hypothetical protein